MRHFILMISIIVASACASTKPAEETARLASQQLLRIETELHAATTTIKEKYQTQQQLTQNNLRAARNSEQLTEAIHREWIIADDQDALQLYTRVLSSRAELRSPAVLSSVPSIAVDTSTIKKSIADLSAVASALSDRNEARAIVEFAKKVQDNR